MGVVYLGVDADNKPVAVKVLHPSIASDQTARMRLAREVRTLRRIHHPRIAAVLDAELETDTPYIVTEFVDGMTLSDDVKENGPFAEDELVHFGHALLDALTAVHNAGVIHRDLKPANVMIMDGEPMVIDFGIAQAADEVKVTVTGLVMGTPGYLSPEIVDGGASSEKTDWWGWAATMAFAATGRNPYGSGGIEAVIARVASGRANLEGAPERFQPLLRACLDPKPERRPSGSMILDALVEIEAGHMPSLGSATPVPLPPSPHMGDTIVGQPGIPGGGGSGGYDLGGPPDPRGRPPQGGHDLGRPLDPRGHPLQGGHPPQGLMGSPRPGGQHADVHVPPAHIMPAPSDVGTHGEYGSHPVPAPPGAYLKPTAGSAKLAAVSVFALSLLSIVVTPLGPLLILVAVIAWQILARTAGTIVKEQRRRLVETGRASTVGAVARLPLVIVMAVVMTIVCLILPLTASLAVAIMMRLDIAGIVPRGYSVEISVWVAAVAGAVVMWFGPGSANLRRGSRQLLGLVVGRSSVGHWILSGMLCVLALLAFLTIFGGASTVWWPLQDNPFDLLPAG